MFRSPARKFFAYGLAIAAGEEFITQGVLKGSYFFGSSRSFLSPFSWGWLGARARS